MTTLTRRAMLRGHEGEVLNLSFSPDGEYLASGSVDGTVRIWSISAQVCVAVVDDLSGQTVTFSISGGDDAG